ncbi:hypothetical protein GO730_10265 [Spirosoma sp. HMF3257]|uniref:Uncharacterized protein n=1 Tax=Spirosoma telluris TaxID=2183553 RepID=A0A327NGN3_9BACT|nr:hypothetical protein [Spirosoma telluris]RAI74541.1 hypothetical protein HMF3257_10175 [Spirosoma telluris]
MILAFTAIDQQARLKEFWYQLSELEVALDVLSTIALKGDKILKAQLIEEGVLTELPVEAFDGEIFTNSIHQLEVQWQTILKEPMRSTRPENTWQIELICKQIKIYDDRIAQFALVIDRFEQLRERAGQVSRLEPNRTNLLNHYESTLTTYRGYINRAKDGQQVAQKKLGQLQA